MCKRAVFPTFLVLAFGVAAAMGAAPLQQDPGPDGIVSVEAENCDEAVEMGSNTWELVTTAEGFTGTFSGIGAMQTLPHVPLGGNSYSSNYADRSPRLDFVVNFEKTGPHYVWVLAYGPDGNSDSCHVGLDGEEIATSETMSGWNGGHQWSGTQMSGPASFFEIADAGVHTVNIWMREDGLAIDKLVLTTNPDFSLSDAEPGPTESGRGPRVAATGANPSDGATDVPRDVVLSWTPGVSTVARDVYFGTVFDDVNDAGRTNPLDVLQAEGQTAITYTPAARLEFEQTYYWRIDEVNTPPDSEIFPGDVWSFTTEPFVYAVENISATASSSTANAGPENTINGSGLDVDDLHSTSETDMWLSESDPNGAWIQYEFDRVYKLYEMWAWNYNHTFEPVLGYGLRDVAVAVSADGVDWTVLTEREFARGAALPSYAHNTIVDLQGVAAKYVRLTAGTNWSAVGQVQFGLSEVRFFYVPAHAREPQPAAGQADVGVDTVLAWRPGREAGSHEVYLSTSWEDVVAGTALADIVTESNYEPVNLRYGQAYYWKVNEVNEVETPSVWGGDIWSFTTAEYRVVDDFETYTNEVGNRVFQTWIDGWGFTEPAPGNPGNGTGATVGHDIWTGDSPHFEGDIIETEIAQSGKQSMPLYYNNAEAPYYSETERTWDTAQDWSANGIDTLGVHFRGGAAGFIETSPGNITMGAAGADVWDMSDEFTFAYKPLNGNGSITVRVDSLGNTDPWAKAGVMIRDSLNVDAKNAMAYVTASGRVGWQYRQLTAGGSSSTRSDEGVITLPYWVRLTRTGDTITAEHSADGTTWEPVIETANPDEPSSLEIPMHSSIFIGLALTSHSSGVTTTADFAEASTSGGATGAWEFVEIGVDHMLNDPDTLYVALQDTAGRTGVVTYPDGTLLGDWTAWEIPLTEFSDQGVNVAGIKKMMIGAGDRDNPTAAGTGMVLIDNIGIGHPGLVDPGNSGLVASYALENNTEDTSGNEMHGTAVGEPLYVDGPAGYGIALEFDGTGSQYVSLGTFDPSADTGLLSVSLWARWNGLTGLYQGLIAKRDGWAADNMMWHIEAHRDTGDVRVGRQGGGTIQAAAPAEGEWEHWAFTFDGEEVALYRGAEEVASGDFSFGTDTEAGVQFGVVSINDDGTGGNPYNGALDEIAIFNRPLSVYEVRYLAGQR